MKIKVKQALAVIGATLVTLSTGFVAQASDAIIEIDPGLYAYDQSGFIGPQPILDSQYEYCLTEDMTKRSLNDVVAELQDGGTCEVSNVRHKIGYGEANVVCQNPDVGTIRGNIRADYTQTSYRVRADAKINVQGVPMPFASEVNARRIGDCPPGWTPPPGISHK